MLDRATGFASHRHRLAGLCVAWMIHVVAAASWAVPSPQGGACPQPKHTLVANEFHVGAGLKPRWLEIINPGKDEVSLKNVVVRVTAKGVGGGSANPDVIEFSIDSASLTLPGGAVIVVGHVPGYDPSKGGLGFVLIDLGPVFQLPICDVKLQIIGPQGIVDTVIWDLCPATGEPDPALWQTIRSLDPDHTDICLNDAADNWCQATTDGLTKPSPGAANGGCDLDGDGFTKATGDCNDKEKGIGPLGFEFCNGIDDNCSGQTDEGVIVLPGTCKNLGVCGLPLPSGSPVAECKGASSWTCTYINDLVEGIQYTYEAVTETICDQLDNDCDGQTDEGLLNACGKCVDIEEVCDGLDNDCDGLTDEEVDLSAIKCSGLGVCNSATAACDPDKGPICEMPLAYEATEVSCDGEDNDCDGHVDEDLGVGLHCVVGTGECVGTGIKGCAPGGKVMCHGAAVGSKGTEICGDGRDNDCDGSTDEGYQIGEQCSVGLGICRADGKKICNAARDGAICNATAGAPRDAELCGNKLDDDCDGQTDEQGCSQSEQRDGITDCSAAPPAPGSAPLPLLLLLGAALIAVTQRRRASR